MKYLLKLQIQCHSLILEKKGDVIIIGFKKGAKKENHLQMKSYKKTMKTHHSEEHPEEREILLFVC